MKPVFFFKGNLCAITISTSMRMKLRFPFLFPHEYVDLLNVIWLAAFFYARMEGTQSK